VEIEHPTQKDHLMNKRFFPILICLLLTLSVVYPVRAQEDEQLTLRLNRDFGYGGFGNDIQGLFSMEIRNAPENLARVVFTIDGELIAEDSEAPFKIQFSTESYPLGEHVLAAIGYLSDGQSIPSNSFTMDFVSPEAGWQAAGKIIVPILGIVLVVMLVSFITTFLTGRKQGAIPAGTQRNYGIKGGTICPKCSRPFAFKLLSLNMGPFHKLDRCPNCGRWGLFRRRSLDELRAAEAAEVSGAQEYEPNISEEEKLRKELEDSRYQNQ
jgi:hypothetical protein